MESSYIVGLDIGSSKVVVIIGELLEDDFINVVGVGEVPSKGVDKGVVTDLDSVVDAILTAVNLAEDMADCKVSSVNLSISGGHIESQNESGTWAIEDREVSTFDIESVLHNARSIKIRDEQRLLHVIPQEYSIDSQDRIKNPLGLSGVKLKANVHLITCHNDLVKNLEKAVERSGLNIDQLTFSAVASSSGILSQDEKDLGVCLIDMGSGTMDLSVYIAGALHYSKSLAYAVNAVTSDIAIAFGAPASSAEEVKIKYGALKQGNTSLGEEIKLASVGGRETRSVKREMLINVIEARYSELLDLVKSELQHVNAAFSNPQVLKKYIAAGIVITGGGSQIRDLVDVAGDVFDNMPIRIGKVDKLQGLIDDVSTPQYSTVLGLLRYKEDEYDTKETESANGVSAFFGKIKGWIKKEF
jgi:cell division protein FtsA